MLKYFLLVVFLAGVAVDATNVRGCASGRPFPLSARVWGCDFMPCTAQHGTNMVLEIDFQANQAQIDAFSPSVVATAFGVVTPYPLPGHMQAGCNSLTNAACPIPFGHWATYRFVFAISSIFPTIPVTVDVSLTDNFGRHFACVSVDLQVTR